MKKYLLSGLLWLRNEVYTGTIKRIIVRLSIDLLIKKIWTGIFLAVQNETYTATVRKVEAGFCINSYPEYRRIDDLIGERLPIQRLLEDVNDGDIFYDIGANIGIYTCFIAASEFEVNTFAFEPHSDNIQRLSKNLKINSDRWQCYQVLLGNEDEMAPFHIASERPGESRHSISSADSQIFTMQRQIDTMVREENLPSPSILKIDVEGAELQVLEGSTETLEKVRVVYCEVHTDDQESLEVKQFLRDSGFQIEILQEGEQTDHLRAIRK